MNRTGPDRRATLGLLGAGLLAASPGRAQEGGAGSPGKGAVFLDYDQAALDRAYDQRVWAPNAADLVKRYAVDSEAVRRRLPPRTVQYGPSADETMDLFGAEPGGRKPVNLHLHGGAWRSLTKEDDSFLAPPVVEAGGIFAAVNFSVMPQVRLPEMMAQCRRAVAWIAAHADDIGADPDRIHVSGHSSGAHMAGVLMTDDWTTLGLAPDVIKSGVLLSGMFDLAPVMLSSRASYVTLLPAEVAELSAMRHLDRLRGTVLVAYGLNESPEFQRQSRDFAAAAVGLGKRVGLLPLPGVNHFEAPYLLADRTREATRLGLALMG